MWAFGRRGLKTDAWPIEDLHSNACSLIAFPRLINHSVQVGRVTKKKGSDQERINVNMEDNKSSSDSGDINTTPSTTVSPSSSVVFDNPPSKLASLTRHFTSPTFSRRAKSGAPLDEFRSTPGTDNGGKGPYGLTTLSRPDNADEAIAHIVFVHGLAGGSEHTWTKDNIFWPRDLLPAQEPFQDAGIHTFGYDSDFKKSSTLNINDFSKSLLNSLINSPSTGHSKVRANFLQVLDICEVADRLIRSPRHRSSLFATRWEAW